MNARRAFLISLAIVACPSISKAERTSREYDPESDPCGSRNGGGYHELGSKTTSVTYRPKGWDCSKTIKQRKCKHCKSDLTVEIIFEGDNCPRDNGPSKCDNEGTA